MKNIISLFLFVSFLFMNFKLYSNGYDEDIISNDSIYSIEVNFEYGEDAPSKLSNIYVIWIEDTLSGFLQNIFICQKLVAGGLTGTALPYWKSNKYPQSSSTEVDAVTSATQAKTDFSVSAVLNDTTVKQFTVYLEIDRYAEPNDWFTDQPALLYSSNINLEDSISGYELSPTGWTPNEATKNIIPNTPFGKLQEEMRYITNHKDGETFGDTDERSATRMVKKITAIITKPIATNTITNKTENISISIYPNPTQQQVNINSNEIINEVVLKNLQGQTIFHIQPKTYKAAFVVNNNISHPGTYIAIIITENEISSHKIVFAE